jgi:hypothetical protein
MQMQTQTNVRNWPRLIVTAVLSVSLVLGLIPGQGLLGGAAEEAHATVDPYPSIGAELLLPQFVHSYGHDTIAQLSISDYDNITIGAFAKKKYVASRKAKVYHVKSCKYVSRILKKNRVYYSSKKKAKKAGKRPCKVCL